MLISAYTGLAFTFVAGSFDLPGLRREGVTINVHDDLLTVSRESRESPSASEYAEDGYAIRERRHGKFARS